MSEVKPIEVRPVAGRNPVRYIFLVALLLLLVWLGLKTWRVVQAARSLQAREDQIAQLMAGGLAGIDPQMAEAAIMGIRRDVVVLKSELSFFLPLTDYLTWLPKFGPLLEASPELMSMADAGTEAAAYAYRALQPALELLQQDQSRSNPPLPELTKILDEARPDLLQANLAFSRLTSARADIKDLTSLPGQVRSSIGLADQWLPMGQAYLKLATVIPDLMGAQGTRHYLVVAQNEDELRPTGGFVSGVGELAIENGRIVALAFQDAYQVDNWQSKPYDLPPQPLYDLMGLELFLFRDSNFWPDFPVSAQMMLNLYRYGQESPTLDGVIAIDQRFTQLLLDATGPIQIPQAGITLDSQTILDSFREAWAFQGNPGSAEWQEWYKNRKSFIGVFASAVQNKIESEFDTIDPIVLAQNIYQAAMSKHLQIYATDPAVATVLAEVNWDGHLKNNTGRDVLMAVDTNVGYTKANVYLERSFAYEVRIQADHLAQGMLTINYKHTGDAGEEDCHQTLSYAIKVVNDYLNLANRCYWNYLRIYTPSGTRMLDSSVHNVPVDSLVAGSGWIGGARQVDEVPGLTTFANYLMVPQGQSLDSRFLYQLPAHIVRPVDDHYQYELQLLQQAGTPPTPVTVTILMPDGRKLVSATPSPAQVDGRRVLFEFVMEQDTLLSLDYR